MLAELTPKPDQVTIAINTNQMNICELLTADDVADTSLANPAFQQAYRDDHSLGTRLMKFIMLYGFGPSKPPPMATQVRFSGPM